VTHSVWIHGIVDADASPQQPREATRLVRALCVCHTQHSHCVEARCIAVLQCVAVCRSVLQCVCHTQHAHDNTILSFLPIRNFE